MLWRPDPTARWRARRTSSSTARARGRRARATLGGAGHAGGPVSDRILFVTGKLAAPALERTLERAGLPFDYEVAVMKITVAALMTPEWIARRLEVPRRRDEHHDPGPVRGRPGGDLRALRDPRGEGPGGPQAAPAPLRPGRGGGELRRCATSACSPRSTTSPASAERRSSTRRTAYREKGADVVDLGLSLDRRWLDEGPEVSPSCARRGFTLSIDTLDPDEILMADEAGVTTSSASTARTATSPRTAGDARS